MANAGMGPIVTLRPLFAKAELPRLSEPFPEPFPLGQRTLTPRGHRL